MRKRFGSALLWYSVLHAQVQKKLQSVLEIARADAREAQRIKSSTNEPRQGTSSAASGVSLAGDATTGDALPDQAPPAPAGASPASEDPLAPRPSAHLQACCPICFGSARRLSQSSPTSPDCLVSIDACFSQKHNKQRRDPIFLHPDDFMIDEATLTSTAEWVEAIRGDGAASTNVKRRRGAQGGGTVTSSIDDPPTLPAESLEQCKSSFKAAQSSIAKASVRRHDVTAAMALLCRHDVPLFWANMTSAGEKQYYVVALMDALTQHLPCEWTIGFLYDIACQTEASAIKWGLFNGYLHRIQFAVAVFHAYGHDWLCQSLYHPRKRIGFGLTDGEGCERFWSSISKLISYLRVAGFHLRLFTLNAQMLYLAETSIQDAGAWLTRKRTLVQTKRKEAKRLLAECGPLADDLAFVRQQWREQLIAQTKPTKGSSRTAARKEIEAVLSLEQEVKKAEKALEAAKNGSAQKGKKPARPRSKEDREADVEASQAVLHVAQRKYNRKVQQLGVDVQGRLSRLKKNKLLHSRANCVVLLRHARDAVMSRQLEMERVNRFQNNKNGDSVLRRHVRTAVDRRAGTLKGIVNRYNKACRDLNARIDDQIARSGQCSVRPLKELPAKGLWDLDIDNACWDELSPVAEPPSNSAGSYAEGTDERHSLRTYALRTPTQRHSWGQSAHGYHMFYALAVDSWRTRDEHACNIARISRIFVLAAMSQELGRILGARVTRRGTVFSNFVPLPENVDLDALMSDAAGRDDEDDVDVLQSDCEDDYSGWDGDSPPDDGRSSPLTPISDDDDDGDGGENQYEIDDGGDDPTLPLPRAPLPCTVTGKNSAQRKSKRQRKEKRRAEGAADGANKRRREEKVLDADEYTASWDLDDAPTTSTAYTALRDAGRSGIPAVSKLQGYSYLQWDGMTGTNGSGVWRWLWNSQQQPPCHSLLLNATTAAASSPSNPMASHTEAVRSRLDHFDTARRIGKSWIDCLACRPWCKSHISAHTWEPQEFEYYADTMAKLFKWKPALRSYKNFANITALGQFDADQGGHLVIVPLRLVIRFPAGSSILIPSAILEHFNLPIGSNEHRQTITQYTGGAIFRFVENGCRNNDAYLASLSREGLEEAVRANRARAKEGMLRMSTLTDLRARYAQEARSAIRLPFPRSSRLQETFIKLDEEGVDELENIACELSSRSTVRGNSDVDGSFLCHLELITIRLMYQRDGPFPMAEAWMNLGNEYIFRDQMQEVHSNVARVREVCHGVFALQYPNVVAMPASSVYTYEINDIVIDLEIVGIPGPSSRQQRSITVSGARSFYGVIMAHYSDFLASCNVNMARNALFYRQINGAYQRVSWWDILPISHGKVRAVVCGDMKFLPSPRPDDDFGVTDFDIGDFDLVPTDRRIRLNFYFRRDMGHRLSEQLAAPLVAWIRIRVMAGGWVLLNTIRTRLFKGANITWNPTSCALLREYPDNYRIDDVPACFEVQWSVPIPIGPYEEELTIYAVCPACVQIAGGHTMRFSEHLPLDPDSEDESDATLRDEQEAIEEQEAQMMAQRQKLRSRSKPAPPPGPGDKTANDSAGKNIAPRGAGKTGPKARGDKARTRSTAKNKNWGPASSRRQLQKPSPSPPPQSSPPPPPAHVGGRRRRLPESGDEADTHKEQGAEEPEARHIQRSREDSHQTSTTRKDGDNPGGPAYASRTSRASQVQGRMVFDCVEIPVINRTRHLSTQLGLAHVGVRPPHVPTNAPAAPEASGEKRKRAPSVEQSPTSASPPVSPKRTRKKAKTGRKDADTKRKGADTKRKGKGGQAIQKVDGKGRAIAIGGMAQGRQPGDVAAQARTEYGDAWLAFMTNERPDPPTASPEAASAMVRDKKQPKATKLPSASRPQTPNSHAPASAFDFSPSTPEPSPCPPPRRGGHAKSNTGSGEGASTSQPHAHVSASRTRSSTPTGTRMGTIVNPVAMQNAPTPANTFATPTRATAARPKRKGTTAKPASRQNLPDVTSLFDDCAEETPRAGPSAKPTKSDRADDSAVDEGDTPRVASSNAKDNKKTGAVPDDIRQTAEKLGMEYLQRILDLAREAGKDPEEFFKLVGWMHSDHYAPRDENMANMFVKAYSATYEGDDRTDLRAKGTAAYHAEIQKLTDKLGRPPTQFEKAEHLQAELRQAADIAAKKRTSGTKGKRVRTMKSIAGKLTQQATSHLFHDGMTAFGWVVDTHALQEHAAGAVMFGAGEAFEALVREYDGNFHEMLDKMTRVLRSCQFQVRSKWIDSGSAAMLMDESEDAVAFKRRDWSPGTQENNCDGYWRIVKECLREDLARESVLIGASVNKNGHPGDLPKQLPYRKLADILYRWELELRGWPEVFKRYAPVMLSNAPKEDTPPQKPLGKDWTSTARDMWLSRKTAETRILNDGLTGDDARQVLRECNAPAILPIPQEVLEGKALADLGATPMVISRETLGALFTWEQRSVCYQRDVQDGTDTRVQWQAWRQKGKGRAGESRLQKLSRRNGKPASLPKPRRRQAPKSKATVDVDNDVEMGADIAGADVDMDEDEDEEEKDKEEDEDEKDKEEDEEEKDEEEDEDEKDEEEDDDDEGMFWIADDVKSRDSSEESDD
ncbi:uncharacterized protein SCHCODRAFT_02515344 [Schizophyllum commune H4-8]|uniref:CxC2-like cysteine cluster KDZ transposase-associated domain-containing protein n=1 Tax=Schizophyllum commune (strain H4-8 / FGSC 9210) TaxID=578458 RepID=D8QFV1_SCHCM|nr:uncharacterized protein SCHCODRAFT_02515344 [Schizophyllum commune H4-8]KAI5887797.1 hypothetical protein SCHCODRAFT_02515344 [Schizophyllum commune H4-8]